MKFLVSVGGDHVDAVENLLRRKGIPFYTSRPDLFTDFYVNVGDHPEAEKAFEAWKAER